MDGSDTENRDEFEDKYFRALTELKNAIDFLAPSRAPSTQSQPIIIQQQHATPQTSQNVKLPEISIPLFCGNISEWESFYQLFSALIFNDTTLTDIQKFIYLKSFLKGEPLKLIEALTLTHDNFKTALDILVERYQNQFVIIKRS